MSEIASPARSLTNQEEAAVQLFVFELKKQFKNAVHAITLYGSKARGDASVDSDIDLLIVMDSDVWEKRNQVSHIASRISLKFDLLLSPHVISKEFWQEMTEKPLSFYKNIFQEGISLL
jgi:predicted nucleotidyltransferase